MFHTLYPQRIQEPVYSLTTDLTDWTELPLELLEPLAGSKTKTFPSYGVLPSTFTLPFQKKLKQGFPRIYVRSLGISWWNHLKVSIITINKRFHLKN